MTTTNKKKKKGLKPNLARAIEAKGRAALDAEGSKVRTDKGGRQLRVTTITPRMNAIGKAELCVCSWR